MHAEGPVISAQLYGKRLPWTATVLQDDGIDPPTNSWQIQRPFNTDQPDAARSSQPTTAAEKSLRAALRV